MENKPTDVQVADSLTIVSACIDIDPALLKHVVVKEGKNLDTPLAVASNKLGMKVGQMGELVQMLFQRIQML